MIEEIGTVLEVDFDNKRVAISGSAAFCLPPCPGIDGHVYINKKKYPIKQMLFSQAKLQNYMVLYNVSTIRNGDSLGVLISADVNEAIANWGK
jgi:hypothetical protein